MKDYSFSEYQDIYFGYREIVEKRTFGQIRKKSQNFSGVQKWTKVIPFLRNVGFTKLMSAYKRNRGITLGGTKTVYTKGSLAKKKLIAYTKTLNAVTKLAMPVIIQKDVNTFRLAATLLTITGAVVQVPATRKMLMFRLQIASNLATIANAKGANYRIFQHRFCEIISFLKARNKVCYIAVTKNSKITLAKANGEYASIVSKKKGTKKAVVLVRLPSTQLKLIDSLTTVLIGTVIVGQKLLFKNTKAGYWRNLGWKPLVRGVVKNPVDHPHGGRERTILWPRTPWGKSTK